MSDGVLGTGCGLYRVRLWVRMYLVRLVLRGATGFLPEWRTEEIGQEAGAADGELPTPAGGGEFACPGVRVRVTTWLGQMRWLGLGFRSFIR